MRIIGDFRIYDLRFTKYDLRYLILASLRSASPRVDFEMYQFENVLSNPSITEYNQIILN